MGGGSLTVNYLRNRSPSSAADGSKTPWELFFGSKPDVTLLRVFGSPAYPLIPKQLRKSKLHPVSRAGRFVGYEPGSKAYRILLDDGSIIVSRDVTFDEPPVDTIPTPEPLGGVEDAIDPPELPEEIAPEAVPPPAAVVPLALPVAIPAPGGVPIPGVPVPVGGGGGAVPLVVLHQRGRECVLLQRCLVPLMFLPQPQQPYQGTSQLIGLVP